MSVNAPRMLDRKTFKGKRCDLYFEIIKVMSTIVFNIAHEAVRLSRLSAFSWYEAQNDAHEIIDHDALIIAIIGHLLV